MHQCFPSEHSRIYNSWVDGIISAYLPHAEPTPEIYDLVETAKSTTIRKLVVNINLKSVAFTLFVTLQIIPQIKSIEEISELLHISVDEYYYYFAISEEDDFQIHLRRLSNSILSTIILR